MKCEAMRKAAMAKGVQFVEQPVTELRMLLGIVTSRWFKGHESQCNQLELYLLPKINPPRAYGKARSTIFRFIFFERDELKHDIRN